MHLLILEQTLNGLQLGVMLFLIAAGLTLVFGIMGLINLAHGSLFMIGAYVAAATTKASGSFLVGILAAVPAAALAGLIIERLVLSRLYARDHLDQVLATFGLILFLNELMSMVFGRQPLFLNVPALLAGSVEIVPGVPYPTYRLATIAVGLALALGLYLLIARTRAGMLIRAGASNREMLSALGVDTRVLYAAVVALGALLAGLAGALAGPIRSVEPGMGEGILIYAFVVVVVGGIGSIRGSFVSAILIGLVDTLGRAFLPTLLRWVLPAATADAIGAALASIAIYILMAVVLAVRPSGLFGAKP